MNKALQHLLWGYLFIFFRIQIGIDWLADPVGYYLIYTGCSHLIEQYPSAKKAQIVARLGIVISIPAVVVNLSAPNLGYWEFYSDALTILKLIVAYFLFAVLKKIVQDYNNRALIKRTQNVYTFYIAIHLSTLTLSSFTLNISGDGWTLLLIMLGIGVVIMDIAFLLLIGAIRRAEPPQASMDILV